MFGKNKKSVDSLLSKDTEFIGELKFYGTIYMEGYFKGEINSTGRLILTDTGRIEGNIHVSSLVSSGEIVGNIIADESIEICVPGKVYGDIHAPTVILHPGVIFKGKCRTDKISEDDVEKLTLRRIPSTKSA